MSLKSLPQLPLASDPLVQHLYRVTGFSIGCLVHFQVIARAVLNMSKRLREHHTMIPQIRAAPEPDGGIVVP